MGQMYSFWWWLAIMAGFTQHLQEGMFASIQGYSSKMQKLGIILLYIIDKHFY